MNRIPAWGWGVAIACILAFPGGCSLPDGSGAASTGQVGEGSLERGEALAQEENWTAAAAAFEQVAASEPDNALAWFKLAEALGESGKLAEAVEATRRAASFPAIAAESWYNLACLYARLGRADEAMAALDEAFDAGFSDFDLMREDPDLAGLQEDPRLERLRGHEFRELVTEDGATLEYALQLPDGYEPDRPYPVLVGMPPGAQDRYAVEWGMAKLWGRQAASRGWAAVSPAVVAPGWQTAKGRQVMNALLDAVAAKIRPEGGKFHLAGCSNGGVSAFHLAIALPERFQSLTVLPGYPASESDRDDLARLRNIRVRLLVGERDGDWVREMTDLQRRMESLDLASTLTVYPGEGHVMDSVLGGGLMDLLAGAGGD